LIEGSNDIRNLTSEKLPVSPTADGMATSSISAILAFAPKSR
jgi:hypothetical protein